MNCIALIVCLQGHTKYIRYIMICLEKSLVCILLILLYLILNEIVIFTVDNMLSKKYRISCIYNLFIGTHKIIPLHHSSLWDKIDWGAFY